MMMTDDDDDDGHDDGEETRRRDSLSSARNIGRIPRLRPGPAGARRFDSQRWASHVLRRGEKRGGGGNF